MKQTITITLIAGAAFGLGACAAGRGPGGEIIVGLDVAKLPETALEAAHAASGFLPAPWGDLAGYAITALGVGGVGAAAAARAKRAGERSGWDEALDPRANAALTLPQLAQPVFVGASGGAAGPVPALPNVSAGAGASAQATASPVVGPSGVAGGDWPASASLPVAQG